MGQSQSVLNGRRSKSVHFGEKEISCEVSYIGTVHNV